MEFMEYNYWIYKNIDYVCNRGIFRNANLYVRYLEHMCAVLEDDCPF
jgi:hypothetical protein